MVTDLEILERARELINRPEKWCQGQSKRWAVTGMMRCSSGALTESMRQVYELTTVGSIETAARLEFYLNDCVRAYDHKYADVNNIVEFNDCNSWERVMDLWDFAIERMKIRIMVEASKDSIESHHPVAVRKEEEELVAV